jgi:hypothetical protein
MGPSHSPSIVVATRHTRRRRLVAAMSLTLSISAISADRAKADAGGLSYWLPGTFGSLAAAPGVPGWAYSTIYLHVQEKAQGDKEFVRGGAKLGNFKGRVAGIGPQIGFLFPQGQAHQNYLNLKACKDFAAENRPEGYTAWVTLAVTPAAPEAPPKSSPIHK